jgi:putative transposase
LGVSLRRATRFHPPGPTRGNTFIEAFNGRLRDECLTVHQFAAIADAQAKIEAWRIDYNQRGPHGSLGHLTPTEFVAQRQVMTTAEAAPVSLRVVSFGGQRHPRKCR